MVIPPHPEFVRNETFTIDDKIYPVLDIKIIPGTYSDESLLTFNWTFVNYTQTELILQIDFDKPNAVSALKDKEYI